MIRPAKNSDIPAILTLGERLHQESVYAHISFDRVKVRALMESLIAGGGVVFVTEKDGVIVGGLAGGITTHWFSEEKIAFDYSFFVAPEHRQGITAFRLLKAFSEWARIKGATEIRMGITTGINVEGTARFYRAAGFSDAGILLCKEVQRGS